MNILIVEDDLNLSQHIKKVFNKNLPVNRVKIINTYDLFLKELYLINTYDLILLDIILWDTKKDLWIDILKLIRKKNKYIPIVIISGLNDVWWIKVSFENWANDYICKPFRLAELEVRSLKWFNKFLNSNYLLEDDDINYWVLTYKLSSNSFFVYDKEMNLSKLNKYILLLFISKPEILLTNIYLIEKIWWDSNLQERNLRVNIMRLKKSLEKYWIDHFINNVRGEWYIFKKD